MTFGGSEQRPSLRWSFRPNRTYTVEQSANLKDWVPAPGDLSYPEKGVAEWIAAAEPAGQSAPGARFLRVRVTAD